MAPLAHSNLQAFLQAKSTKSLRGETCKINQHLSKVLYFTVVLHILQCAHMTYMMLTHHMKAFPTYSNFHLKIIQKCVEKQCRKSCQFFLPPGLGFDDILAQNQSKIVSKSLKIVLAPKKRHRAPPKASKKAPEASAAATGCVPKLPKTAPRSLKRVKVIRQFTLVYSLQ